jgi:CDP-diacylglycerol--glycerol-3-phosphate 3-phosphatidyltransferase
MLDPIADKAMVVIALVIITGYSGMNPWLILPVTVILFREVFVSGLREYLGADAGRLKVTKLAKWKTTAQMFAIAILFLGTGLNYLEAGLPPRAGEGDLPTGASPADLANHAGLALIWVAAVLTGITGWDYFAKALPFLREHKDG